MQEIDFNQSPEKATLHHKLCFLYYTLSVVGDGEIMDTAVDSIVSCIKEWKIIDSYDIAKQVADQSLIWWKSTPLRERAQLCLSLFKTVSESDILEDKEHILQDLVVVAKSDGIYTDTEKLFIQEVAHDLGMKDARFFE